MSNPFAALDDAIDRFRANVPASAWDAMAAAPTNRLVVKALLNYHLCPPYPPLLVDGDWRPEDEARLGLFRRLHGIGEIGFGGPLTWDRLVRLRWVVIRATVRPNPTFGRPPHSRRRPPARREHGRA